MDYHKLFEQDLQRLGAMENYVGQVIEFYEHPTEGDFLPVIAVCHKLQVATITDFYDIEDMIDAESDYSQVVTTEGKIICKYLIS